FMHIHNTTSLMSVHTYAPIVVTSLFPPTKLAACLPAERLGSPLASCHFSNAPKCFLLIPRYLLVSSPICTVQPFNFSPALQAGPQQVEEMGIKYSRARSRVTKTTNERTNEGS